MPTSGSLTKAKLRIEGGQTIDCWFNPKEYTVTKQNQWKIEPVTGTSLPTAQFGGGQGQKLTLDLLFDASDKPNGDVRTITDALFESMEAQSRFATGNNSARPPTIEFQWGMTSTFKAVADSLSIQFLMFRPDGVPVRAQAKLSLIQVAGAVGKAKARPASGSPAGTGAPRPGNPPGTNPTTRGIAGLSSHVVRDGDTLQGIAYASYGDPTLWRRIAVANGVDDPMKLRRGTILSIPTLND
ncbi:MAG: LysM peptidoglycan-binding domain-containing protein [Actinomycetota bacterium]